MNPQHPVLETGALPIGATGLYRNNLFCFLMYRMFVAEATVFFVFQSLRMFPLIFCCIIIAPLTIAAGQRYFFSCHIFLSRSTYSITSEITPAPTVRPPSRMAKRSSFSMAIGVINSTSMVILSPGIIISTPLGK